MTPRWLQIAIRAAGYRTQVHQYAVAEAASAERTACTQLAQHQAARNDAYASWGAHRRAPAATLGIESQFARFAACCDANASASEQAWTSAVQALDAATQALQAAHQQQRALERCETRRRKEAQASREQQAHQQATEDWMLLSCHRK